MISEVPYNTGREIGGLLCRSISGVRELGTLRVGLCPVSPQL